MQDLAIVEYLQNILKTFLYLVTVTCEKLKIIITVKCSNLLSKTVFKFYFHLQNFVMQFGKAVFAAVKVSASAYPFANKEKNP